MWYAVGAAAAILTTFGFVPQIMKMTKTRRVKDVSLITMVQFSLGVSIWAIYGIHQRDVVIIVANVVSLVILLSAIVLYFHYKYLED